MTRHDAGQNQEETRWAVQFSDGQVMELNATEVAVLTQAGRQANQAVREAVLVDAHPTLQHPTPHTEAGTHTEAASPDGAEACDEDTITLHHPDGADHQAQLVAWGLVTVIRDALNHE